MTKAGKQKGSSMHVMLEAVQVFHFCNTYIATCIYCSFVNILAIYNILPGAQKGHRNNQTVEHMPNKYN